MKNTKDLNRYNEYYYDYYGEPINKAKEKRVDAFFKEAEIIFNLIRTEAKKGTLYTSKEFSVAFANKYGLKSRHHLYQRLQILAAKEWIAFSKQHLPHHSYGHLCVIGMTSPFDPNTSKKTETQHPIIPTHKENQGNGVIEPIDTITRDKWALCFDFAPLEYLIVKTKI